jgi:hypothetical protein
VIDSGDSNTRIFAVAQFEADASNKVLMEFFGNADCSATLDPISTDDGQGDAGEPTALKLLKAGATQRREYSAGDAGVLYSLEMNANQCLGRSAWLLNGQYNHHLA